MTPLTYQLPNGTVPVLLSSDTPDLLRHEAASLLSYAADHPDVAPQAIAGMLFRTRTARRHRALAMVADRDDLVEALQAVVSDREHPSLVRTNTPATIRRRAYVFPGQGSQRPGMGRLFYESMPAFRAEADRCAAAFATQFNDSPLDYLLNERFPAEDRAGVVQPALFTHMAGLAALWRSFGIVPNVTIGHSQGEIAAAYVSGAITLADAVRIVAIRAQTADEFASGDYAMAVVAADRDTCEDILARSPGWAQLSVVNSPAMVGISGDREMVQRIVDTFTQRGTFARIIRVHYPAHTSLINELGAKARVAMQRQLQNPKFLDTEIDCLGATLGGPITPDLPMDQYWFWNLRNTVRFDRAIAAAVQRDVDTFVELAEHPTLQLAIHENLATQSDDRPRMVVGTTDRAAADLDQFTRNLAQLALHDLDYSWDCLGTPSGGPISLPLLDFPNTCMHQTRLWLPYEDVQAHHAHQPPATASMAVAEGQRPVPETTPARRLAENWVRLSQRSLLPPRVIGIADHTGFCSDLVSAVCMAAGELGAAACLIGGENAVVQGHLDTQVILIPQSPALGDRAAAAEVATFFGNRTWWPALSDGVSDCWLVTVAGEAVIADDVPPDPVHAAASAGFRCIGAEHLDVRFRHLDLPAGLTAAESADAILAAVHTPEEPELAFRNGGLYAKRLVESETRDAASGIAPPEHALIIGGTGNLGLEFCDHFAHRGVRRITLVSRSGETAAVAARLQQIRSATPTQIRVTSCDVGDPAAVSQLASANRDTPADLIIHAAVDAYAVIEYADITAEKANQALRAKVVGISRILQAFPRTDNCRVALCSSAAATIGGRGQVLYAAANRMLDAMAHRFRAQGLDCVSVQWGQWVHHDLDAAGMARLSRIGVLPMSSGDAITMGMASFRHNAIVAAFDFDRARPVLETLGYGPLVSQLSPPLVDMRASAERTELPRQLIHLFAEVTGVDRAETIDVTVPMVAIGLDSLQALELRRRVKAELNHDLEVSDLLGGASVADILAQLGAP
ncbi:polyketide synthase [Mycobacterium kansasii]|uniref:Narbonolide/10-deoxymethynolide synthase PikA3, module 5 n=1 Tax=Mycobacterium innocens TaxID=2341083 RepID=A0A498Q7V9_9MYCO|nr:polyketide synthase [Mycobacterium kansasii]VBA41381.1 Narbonolide/10-deoxymethynolide synthase PikA3, module 5 [Mycobacterium innocens]